MKYKQHARGKAPKHKLQRFSRFAHFTPAATEAAPFARHAVPLFFSSGSWNEAAETAALAIVQRPVSIFTMPSSASLKILRQILNGFLSLDFINRSARTGACRRGCRRFLPPSTRVPVICALTPIQTGHRSEFFRQFQCQRALYRTPAPVSAAHPWGIHTAFGPQPKMSWS